MCNLVFCMWVARLRWRGASPDCDACSIFVGRTWKVGPGSSKKYERQARSKFCVSAEGDSGGPPTIYREAASIDGTKRSRQAFRLITLTTTRRSWCPDPLLYKTLIGNIDQPPAKSRRPAVVVSGSASSK